MLRPPARTSRAGAPTMPPSSRDPFGRAPSSTCCQQTALMFSLFAEAAINKPFRRMAQFSLRDAFLSRSIIGAAQGSREKGEVSVSDCYSNHTGFEGKKNNPRR